MRDSSLRYAAGLLVFGGALGLYLATLAPTITWANGGADAAELAAAAKGLGVPHPSGYPLFILMGKLFTWLVPWGDTAHRLNFMSALTASLAALTLFYATYLLLRRLTAGPHLLIVAASTVASLAYAFSPIVWSQA